MGTQLTYAAILTIVGAGLRLLLYFTGYETEKLATGQHFQWLGMICMIVILALGIKAVRDESPGGYMSYGKGVGTGVLISLFSGLMSAVYNFIHLKFVNTQFADYQMELIRAKWEKAGMSADQMEKAEGFARMTMGPIAQAIATPIVVVVFGLIIALIAAAFLKRPAPADSVAA